MKGITLSSFNWPGLITGLLMIILPFAGAWWIATVGTGAVEIALSPFNLRVSLLGTQLSFLLVDIFLLATRIMFMIAGVFLILGSLWTWKWWSRPLVRFGVMKPFWSAVGLVIMLAIGFFVISIIMPMLPAFMDESIPLNFTLQLPFVIGTSVSTISMQNVTISAPTMFSFTLTFWLAVATAAVGIAARIYHRRFKAPEKTKPSPAESEVRKKHSE